MIESKLSNFLDPDENPEILDFPDVYILPRNLEYWRVRQFSNRPKIRSEYSVLYRLAVLTQNDVLLKYMSSR